jgi:hypothetical protein
MKREHKDKEGKIVWTEYYHSVLEAKLVLKGEMVVSIATEFIENGETNMTKQDCERTAFKRLAKKLKERFPRLPMCLCMDSLYACGPVFDLCRENNWHYLIRFKDGSLKTVAEIFHGAKTQEPSQVIETQEPETGITETYRYVTGITYKTHHINIVEYKKSEQPYPFVYVMDLPLTRKNCVQTVMDGRRRWKIENEGFNAQKNQGYGLEHLFCKDYTAMKNHYLCIQIGHMIFQLFTNAYAIWKSLNLPLYAIVTILLQSFQAARLSHADNQDTGVQNRYRFP